MVGGMVTIAELCHCGNSRFASTRRGSIAAHQRTLDLVRRQLAIEVQFGLIIIPNSHSRRGEEGATLQKHVAIMRELLPACHLRPRRRDIADHHSAVACGSNEHAGNQHAPMVGRPCGPNLGVNGHGKPPQPLALSGACGVSAQKCLEIPNHPSFAFGTDRSARARPHAPPVKDPPKAFANGRQEWVKQT